MARIVLATGKMTEEEQAAYEAELDRIVNGDDRLPTVDEAVAALESLGIPYRRFGVAETEEDEADDEQSTLRHDASGMGQS